MLIKTQLWVVFDTSRSRFFINANSFRMCYSERHVHTCVHPHACGAHVCLCVHVLFLCIYCSLDLVLSSYLSSLPYFFFTIG